MGNKIRYTFWYMIGYVRGYINIRRKRLAALLFMLKHCSSDEFNEFLSELEKIRIKGQSIGAGVKANGIDKEASEAIETCYNEVVRLYNNYTGRYGRIFF